MATQRRGLALLGPLGLAALLVCALAAAQESPAALAARLRPSDAIPWDPLVRTATLPNGLRYYVRANARPRNRVELRLVVNAGSLLEDDNQRGYAHLIEHLAFGSTAHFPGRELHTFFGTLGLRVGIDFNASTGRDQTVFRLVVPTTSPDVVDRAMLALEDWAHGIAFDAAEIERERSVLIEEGRVRDTSGTRVSEAWLDLIAAGSRYAGRGPTGTVESLQSIDPGRLRRFYRDWYRPDLMAVIVVGDVDAAAAESLVVRHFGALPKVSRPRARQAFSPAGSLGDAIRCRVESGCRAGQCHFPHRACQCRAGDRGVIPRGPRGESPVGHRIGPARGARED